MSTETTMDIAGTLRETRERWGRTFRRLASMIGQTGRDEVFRGLAETMNISHRKAPGITYRAIIEEALAEMDATIETLEERP